MEKPQKAVSIFDYFDYREYLGDVYNNIKSQRHGYSYRLFASEAGISSHNFLPRILRRERNLSSEFIIYIAAYLKLSAKEAKYFHLLVAFNNAKKPSIKEMQLKQLLSLRVVIQDYKIKDQKLHFFDKWYYPVIRELVCICDFQENYNVLANHCIPRISAEQAKLSVAFLIQNGFIKKNNDGRYSATEALISTEKEIDSAIIPKYHTKTLSQCITAIETVKKEERNFSSSTMLVSKELYEEFKNEIFYFRKRLLAMAKECNDPEMVCFAGFQLIPRSEIIPAADTKIASKGDSNV